MQLSILMCVGRRFSKCPFHDPFSAPECKTIARISAVASAIFTAPRKMAPLFEAPRRTLYNRKSVAIFLQLNVQKKSPLRKFLHLRLNFASEWLDFASEWRKLRFWHTQFRTPIFFGPSSSRPSDQVVKSPIATPLSRL